MNSSMHQRLLQHSTHFPVIYGSTEKDVETCFAIHRNRQWEKQQLHLILMNKIKCESKAARDRSVLNKAVRRTHKFTRMLGQIVYFCLPEPGTVGARRVHLRGDYYLDFSPQRPPTAAWNQHQRWRSGSAADSQKHTHTHTTGTRSTHTPPSPLTLTHAHNHHALQVLHHSNSSPSACTVAQRDPEVRPSQSAHLRKSVWGLWGFASYYFDDE